MAESKIHCNMKLATATASKTISYDQTEYMHYAFHTYLGKIWFPGLNQIKPQGIVQLYIK